MKPKLRFKNFNDNWITCTIKDVADVVGGGTPDTSNPKLWNGSINWFTPSEIGKSKYISNSERKITELGVQKSSAKLLPIGTILLSSRATVGEASILQNNQACTNQGFQSLIAHKNINNEFLYYLKDKYKKNMLNKAFGSTFLEISKSNIEKIKINIPTIEEQTKISNFLSLLDKKIELQSKKIEDLKLFKKGLFNMIFNEVDGKDYLLSDVVLFENGKGHENIVDDNGEYVLINSKFISTEGNVIKKCTEQLTPLYKNDITMVMSDLPNGKALAKCYYIEDDNKYSLNQRICRIQVKDNNIINSKYLYYLLNRNPYYLKFDDGVNQTNLKKDDILNINILLPSIDIQEENSKILTIMDNLIDRESNKLSKLYSLKKGLMQSMFV